MMYNAFQRRLHDLRRIGFPERQYLGSTPFDGQGLIVVNTFEGIDELVARLDVRLNQLYGGVFQQYSPEDPRLRIAAEQQAVVRMVNYLAGSNVASRIPIVDFMSPNNYEAHLFGNPLTRATHAFFLPSRAFIEEATRKYASK